MLGEGRYTTVLGRWSNRCAALELKYVAKARKVPERGGSVAWHKSHTGEDGRKGKAHQTFPIRPPSPLRNRSHLKMKPTKLFQVSIQSDRKLS